MQRTLRYRNRSGFSLVELSIVLVILGLLTGGILGGQSLMRASELRSITQDLQKFQISVNTFRDKYFYLPGDMKNAYAFWGVANGCTDADVMVSSAGCNGDGNGEIEEFLEAFRMWQHLNLAGLLEGSYTGTAITNNAVLGENIPRSKSGNSGYQALYSAFTDEGWTNASSLDRTYIRYGLWSAFGGTAGNPSRIGLSALKCEESWNIDTKIDDGKPGLGIWTLHYSVSSSCITTTDAKAANYILSGSNNAALIHYQFLK